MQQKMYQVKDINFSVANDAIVLTFNSTCIGINFTRKQQNNLEIILWLRLFPNKVNQKVEVLCSCVKDCWIF